jgi:hypothetical protein
MVEVQTWGPSKIVQCDTNIDQPHSVANPYSVLSPLDPTFFNAQLYTLAKENKTSNSSCALIL